MNAAWVLSIYLPETNELWPVPSTIYKINSKHTRLKCKNQNCDTLRKKLGEDFCDTVLGKDFLIMN